MTDDEAGVRDAVRGWLTAIAAADGTRACAAMAASARRQLTARQPGLDCAEAVRLLAEALGAERRAQLPAVPVGDVTFRRAGEAIATLGGDMRLALRKERGRWAISDLMTVFRTGAGGAFP